MKLVLGHLYPEYLNIYADRGNIAVLTQRAAWRGIEVEVLEFERSLHRIGPRQHEQVLH